MVLDLLDRLIGALLPREATRPDRVIVYGRYQWRGVAAVAADAPVWQAMPGVAQVEVAETTVALLRKGWRGGRSSIAIPLRERALLWCPRLYWGLMPSRAALAICRNKAQFDRFVKAAGLADLAPRSYRSPAEAIFPCVLKRLNKNAGIGVAIVNSAAELAALLRIKPWRNRPVLLQELVPGSTDFATHCVCRSGRIIWHTTYQYELDPALPVQTPHSIQVRRRAEASAAELAQMERFLVPLAYDGPASFDYRRRPDGGVIVFEINPRFGGTMMRPENSADLKAALAVLVANAVPPEELRRAGRLPWGGLDRP